MFERGSKRCLGKVYSSYFGIVGQGIDDQLETRSGGCCLSSQRHEDNGLFTFFRSDSQRELAGRRRVRITDRWYIWDSGRDAGDARWKRPRAGFGTYSLRHGRMPPLAPSQLSLSSQGDSRSRPIIKIRYYIGAFHQTVTLNLY